MPLLCGGTTVQQITITEEALPILKSGIALKERLLNIKAEDYQKRLKAFEKGIR